ncbi:MAG: ABC transporter permease [Oscillospiraceae bacterium]
MPEKTLTASKEEIAQLARDARAARRKDLKEKWHRFCKNKVALVGLIVIVLLVLIAIFAPYLSPYRYDAVDPINAYASPSREHPFGTDFAGRDLMSRVLYGTRYSLAIAVASQATGIILAIILGSLAGFFTGLISDIIMRFCDIFQSIPATLMAILVSQTLGSGFFATTIALAVTTVPSVTRVARSLIMQIRNQDYIEAGRAITCSQPRLIIKHIIPNIIPQIIISFTGGLSGKFIESASLSYLGLGIQEPLPEWGAILTSGKNYLRHYPHLVVAPGVFIMIAALAFNLVGDGLRDALDPRLRD